MLEDVMALAQVLKIASTRWSAIAVSDRMVDIAAPHRLAASGKSAMLVSGVEKSLQVLVRIMPIDTQHSA